jgi:hypothetical protein
LRERLALFERHQFGDGFDARAKDVGGFAHYLVALEGGHLAPDFERAIGGGERPVEIGACRIFDLADPIAGGRIEDIDACPAASLAP